MVNYSTAILDFCSRHVLYDTSYLNMQHLGAGHFFRSDLSFWEIPAMLYPKSITTDILEKQRFLKPSALMSSAD